MKKTSKKKDLGNKVAAMWANRINRTGAVSPDKMVANPFNGRSHDKAQTEAIVGVLNEVGWAQ